MPILGSRREFERGSSPHQRPNDTGADCQAIGAHIRGKAGNDSRAHRYGGRGLHRRERTESRRRIGPNYDTGTRTAAVIG
jgi:hypothetical protein